MLGINSPIRVARTLVIVATLIAGVASEPSELLGGILQTDIQSTDASRSQAVAICLEADQLLESTRKNLVLDRAAKNERVTDDDLRGARLAARDLYIRSLEFWAASGDAVREAVAYDRISIMSSGLRDGPMRVWSLERELAAWTKAGNVREQLLSADELAYALWIQREFDKAQEAFERAVEIAKSARLSKEHRWELERARDFYKKRGDKIGVARCEIGLSDLAGLPDEPDQPRERDRPVPIPALWLDIPSCPLAAVMVDVAGGKRSSGLRNRSNEDVIAIIVGCVSSDAGRIRVGESLVPWNIYDGSLAPGDVAQGVFQDLDGPANDWTDAKKSCAERARFAVLEVTFDDGSKWKADGRTWPK